MFAGTLTAGQTASTKLICKNRSNVMVRQLPVSFARNLDVLASFVKAQDLAKYASENVRMDASQNLSKRFKLRTADGHYSKTLTRMVSALFLFLLLISPTFSSENIPGLAQVTVSP